MPPSKPKDINKNEEYEDENSSINKEITDMTFIKKDVYTKYDLIDRYNYRRYQTFFMVYKLAEWWNVFDRIASFSHIFNGFIIIYIALYKNVSFFMVIYVVSVTTYYMRATYKL